MVSARLPRQRMLDAVVKQAAVRELCERVMERTVPELFLEGLALVHVPGSEHDAFESLVAQEVGGDRLDVAVRLVVTADTPLEALRGPRRVGGHALQERGHQRGVVGVDAVEEGGASGGLPVGAEDPVDGPGQGADHPVARDDRDDVGRVLHDRLQPLLALRCKPVQLQGVLDTAAPLSREDCEQGRERQYGGHVQRRREIRPSPPARRPGSAARRRDTPRRSR